MKAIFNLNNEQFNRAIAMTAKVEAYMAEYQQYIDKINAGGAAPVPHAVTNCGVYTVDDHPCINYNQGVWLSGKRLIVEGERCALDCDGGFQAAQEILGPGEHTPAKYETSDARLKWNETLRDYLWGKRKALSQVIRAIERGCDEAKLNAAYTTAEIKEAKEVMAAT